jgi:hypothetical protein
VIICIQKTGFTAASQIGVGQIGVGWGHAIGVGFLYGVLTGQVSAAIVMLDCHAKSSIIRTARGQVVIVKYRSICLPNRGHCKLFG